MAATTSTASALMGSKLSAPRVGRGSSQSSGLRKRIMPGRVKAVIEDTSKKNDSTSISKDILDKVGTSFTISVTHICSSCSV